MSPTTTNRILFRRDSAVLKWWLLGPLILLIAIFGWWTAWNRSVALQVENEIAKLRQAGLPVDAASLAQYWYDHTSTENTGLWSQLLFEDLAIVDGVPGVVPTWSPDNSWLFMFPEEMAAEQREEVAEFLQLIQPILDKIPGHSTDGKPVFLPGARLYRPFFLPHSVRSLDTLRLLLNFELEHSLASQDPQRALRVLDQLMTYTNAVNWSLSPYDLTIHAGNRAAEWRTIRRCLILENLSNEDLHGLLKKTGEPINPLENWDTMIHAFRGRWIAILQRQSGLHYIFDPSWLFNPDAQTLRVLDFSQQLLLLNDGNPNQLSYRLQTLMEQRTAEHKGGLEILSPVDPGGYMGAHLVRAVDETHFHNVGHRLTRTAIGVRLFRQSFGRWPQALTELTAVGLQPEDWTRHGSEPFGLHIQDDVAFLWSHRLTNPDIMPDRLDQTADADEWQNHSLTAIRYAK